MVLIGLQFEPNKTELIHYAPKAHDTQQGRKPIDFNSLFSSLLSVQLHSSCPAFTTVTIHPVKEWHYLGFYFDPFLSFSSHVSWYANKALKVAQKLRIMRHCYSGINPKLCQHVYYAVCWSVMTYGMPLWYTLQVKGIKLLVKKLSKMQNVALRWIAGAFCTTPVVLLELFTGIAPITVHLDFQLHNFMACVSTVPSSHLLCQLATTLPLHSQHALGKPRRCAPSDNIHLLRSLIKDFCPFTLFSPIL